MFVFSIIKITPCLLPLQIINLFFRKLLQDPIAKIHVHRLGSYAF